ncbi:MAG TPA: hypothetical protein VKD90_03625 [Gemmataceae bacterium]|nr:hypothetical protein [Gemmataceae bacterium]
MEPERDDFADLGLPPDRMPSLRTLLLLGAAVAVFGGWAIALWWR